MSDEISDEILDAALNPKRARADDQEVEAHSLSDLIKADKYVKGKEAAARVRNASGWGFLRAARAIPPGAAE